MGQAQGLSKYATVYSCTKCNNYCRSNELTRCSPKLHRVQAVCVMAVLSLYCRLPASHQLHRAAQNVVVTPCLGGHRGKLNPKAQ